MLIGQWVDKDSTISLRNEPLHRRPAASEEQDRKREKKRDIMRHVWVFASSVLSFQSSERCVGVCVCGHLVARQTFTYRVKQYLQNVNFFGHRGGRREEKGSRVSAGWHCIFGITLRGLKEVYEPKGVEKLSQLMEEQVILQLIWKHENCGNWSCEVFHPNAVTHRSIFKPRLGYGARWGI